MSAMWSHFANLISHSWQAFLRAEGTTGLGWIGDRIALPVASFVVAVIVIGMRDGKAAAKEHWGKTLTVAFVAAVVVLMVWHGTILGWKVISTTYKDHMDLVAANHILREENQQVRQQMNTSQSTSARDNQTAITSATEPLQDQIAGLEKENSTLSADLQNRENNLHTEDIGFRKFRDLFGIFSTLKTYPGLPKLTRVGPSTACEIEISFPVGDTQSAEISNQFLVANEMAQTCRMYSPFERSQNISVSASLQEEARKESESGMEDGAILMHVSNADADAQWARWLYDALYRVVRIKKVATDMPKPRVSQSIQDSPSVPIIWFQLGRGVKWNK